MDLNQVTVGVTDLDAAIAFYQKLGLKLIVHTHDVYARFECPDGGATFSLHLTDTPTENGPTIYFECHDLDEVFARLRADGIVFDGEPEDQT
ncbi:MAG: VOC family protein [Pseudomonadota bacterium]